MTAEATRHLIAHGVRMMGVDAITFDPPVWAMFEQKHFWEAHLVMMDEDYWHLENLTNLDALPSHGFKLSVFPDQWMGTTAAPVRAVAISMTEPVVWFGDGACRDLRVAGGKGASLAAMAAAGLNVPPGFVIRADVMASLVDAEELRACARSLDWEGAQALVGSCDPPREPIGRATSAWVARSRFARRPVRRIPRRRASRGSRRLPRGRRGRRRLRPRGRVLGIVLQRARPVLPLAEGLARGSRDGGRRADDDRRREIRRSLHRRSGRRRRDRLLVEAVFGLGEQVVSGEVTPDHYIVDRRGEVKTERLVHGGVLTPDELRTLVAAGTALEERFGKAQDIEWAIVGETLFLLQSRPVTTL